MPDAALLTTTPLLLSSTLVWMLGGAVVVVLLACVGVLVVSRQLAARREAELHRDLHEQRLDIERREQRLAEREAREDDERRRLEEQAAEVAGAAADRAALLERVARLSVDEARSEVLATAEHEARLSAATLARDIETEARRNAESEAKRVLSTAIQRLASEQSADLTVSVVHLASDDLKGRIIGREGRNIRAFEQITGVNLVIDDTPEAVVLSCFDPVRREVARVALEELLADGRVHPTRIEEVYGRSVEQVEGLCRTAGEDACLEMGISDLHPELVLTMGRLRYRTSYGQNVLAHLVESGHAAGLLADELGVDRTVCVRGAFLHDIGKALTHEVEGSHAIVGADLARRHGEHEDVVHAIEAHHNEVEPRTVEAWLTQAADAISGGRPGARRESLESYVKRLERLEQIALARPGVEKVYAMQAGRDLRVMVLPDAVDDLQAQVLARDLAKQIEEELTYPGQIKVTVIRESRATEVAR
jgi:ribonuclease Y